MTYQVDWYMYQWWDEKSGTIVSLLKLLPIQWQCVTFSSPMVHFLHLDLNIIFLEGSHIWRISCMIFTNELNESLQRYTLLHLKTFMCNIHNYVGNEISTT